MPKPTNPQHCRVKLSYLVNGEVENVLPVACIHETRNQTCCDSYNRCQYLHMWGGDVGGISVFEPVLKHLSSAKSVATIMPYIRGRQAARSVAHLHPPHIQLALERVQQKYPNWKVKDSNIFTLACFEEKTLTNATGDFFLQPLDTGLRQDYCTQKYFQTDITDNWKATFTGARGQEMRALREQSVVDDVEAWIVEMYKGSTTGHLITLPTLSEDKSTFQGKEYRLYTGVSDGKNVRLRADDLIRVPLDVFKIAGEATKGEKQHKKDSNRMFWMQQGKKYKSGSWTKQVPFSFLALAVPWTAKPVMNNQEQVTDGFLLVKKWPESVFHYNDPLWLRLSGPLSSIEVLDHRRQAMELEVFQKRMPSGYPLMVMVQHASGTWLKASNFDYQDVSLESLLLPKLRLPWNTAMFNWSAATQHHPQASQPLLINLKLTHRNDVDGGSAVELFAWVREGELVTVDDTANAEHQVLEVDLNKTNPGFSNRLRRPGKYSAEVGVFYAKSVSGPFHSLNWPRSPADVEPWVCLINRFIQLKPGSPKEVAVEWRQEQVELNKPFTIVARVWDSGERKNRDSRLLCKTPDLQRMAGQGLKATLTVLGQEVSLVVNTKTRWAEEEDQLGCRLEMEVSLTMGHQARQRVEDVLERTCSQGKADLCLKATLEIGDLPMANNSGCRTLQLQPGRPARILLSHPSPLEYANSEQISGITAAFFDCDSLPTVWGEPGWNAAIVVMPAQGPPTISEPQPFDSSSHAITLSGPSVQIPGLLAGTGGQVEVNLELTPPSAAEESPALPTRSNKPLNFHIHCSQRPAVLKIRQEELGPDQEISLLLPPGQRPSGTIFGKTGHPLRMQMEVIRDGGEPFLPCDLELQLGDDSLVELEGTLFTTITACEPCERILTITIPGFDVVEVELTIQCLQWKLHMDQGVVQVGQPLPIKLLAQDSAGTTWDLKKAADILGPPDDILLELAGDSLVLSGELQLQFWDTDAQQRRSAISPSSHMLCEGKAFKSTRWSISANKLPGTGINVNVRYSAATSGISLCVIHGDYVKLHMRQPPKGPHYNLLWLRPSDVPFHLLDSAGNVCPVEEDNLQRAWLALEVFSEDAEVILKRDLKHLQLDQDGRTIRMPDVYADLRQYKTQGACILQVTLKGLRTNTGNAVELEPIPHPILFTSHPELIKTAIWDAANSVQDWEFHAGDEPQPEQRWSIYTQAQLHYTLHA